MTDKLDCAEKRMALDDLRRSTFEQLVSADKTVEELISESIDNPLSMDRQKSLDEQTARAIQLKARLKVLDDKKIPDAESVLVAAIAAECVAAMEEKTEQYRELQSADEMRVREFFEAIVNLGAAANRLGLTSLGTMRYPKQLLLRVLSWLDGENGRRLERVKTESDIKSSDAVFDESAREGCAFSAELRAIESELEALKSGRAAAQMRAEVEVAVLARRNAPATPVPSEQSEPVELPFASGEPTVSETFRAMQRKSKRGIVG